MDILIIVSQLILSLSILIVLHEFGHFIPAKLFKIKVEKFYLFFDAYFSLFKKKIGETEWGIGWLPLGGYVKIAGMIDESMDREQMAQPPKPWEFRSKPAWQRLIVMLGGVTVNFILGILVWGMVLFIWGKSFLPTANVDNGFHADSMAVKMGFQTGDKVLTVDNEEVKNYAAIRSEIFLKESKTVQVLRDGKETEFSVPQELTGKLASYKGTFITPRMPFKVVSFSKKASPAKESGMKVDDQVIAFNGEPIEYYDEFQGKIKGQESKEITVTVLRNQKDTVNLKMTTTDEGRIGTVAYPFNEYFTLDTINYSFGESIPAGYKESVDFLGMQINAFGQMFRGKVKASESLGGFGSIAQMFGTTWEWERFWKMTAILSLILAFMNLLPIPALDGGHVMFLLYEMISGRKPSDKFMEYATIIGFVIIIGLVLYANGLDVLRGIRGN